MQDDRVGRLARGFDDGLQLVRAERHGFLRRWGKRDLDAAPVTPERGSQLFGTEVVAERNDVRQRVVRSFGVHGRHVERASDVGEHRIEVEEDRGASARERRGEVGGDERHPDAAPAAVHRDHGRQARGPTNVTQRRRGGAHQLLPLSGPQEVPRRAGADRGAEGGDRLARVERQDHAGVRACLEQRGLGHDDVRLELSHRLDELPIVPGRGDDARPPAPVEDVHHLLDDLRCLEREHDPRELIHGAPPPLRGTTRGGVGEPYARAPTAAEPRIARRTASVTAGATSAATRSNGSAVTRVASAKTVSPSKSVCAGRIARSIASFATLASRRASAFVRVAFVATTPIVVAVPGSSRSTRSSRRSPGARAGPASTTPSRSTTSPTAFTTNSAPTTSSPSATHQVPSPPGTARSGPHSLATVAPVPPPTRPSATSVVAARQARYPSSGPGRREGSPTPRSKITAAGTVGTRTGPTS